MFSSKADKQKAARQAVTQRTAPSLIAANMSIVGNIKSDGEVQVDGTLEGDVCCGKLLIGESARMHGEIVAKEVIVRGHVNGLIKGGAVQLSKTARVIGDISHDSLAIESGAYLEGHCRRNGSSGDTLAPAPAAKLPAGQAQDKAAAAQPATARKAAAGAS